MKKLSIITIVLAIISTMAFTQNITITDDDAYSADTSAMLDVKSDNKGFLIPRLNNTQIANIHDPATGLLVFNNTENKFYYYNGSEWIKLNSGNPDNLWTHADSLVYLNDTLTHFGVGTKTPTGKFEVWADQSIGENDPLFEVKNKNGETVFGVYSNGVHVYVDESSKGNIGGFAVSGRSATKSIQDYLLITPDSTRIYIDTASSKGNIGGFAVSGRSATKTNPGNYLEVTPGNTNVYIDENTKGNIGGFAVSGRSATKLDQNQFLKVTPDSTRIYVKDSTAGFAVGNIETGTRENFLNITKRNSFLGHESGYSNTTGYYNSFLGYRTGYSNQNGKSNVFMGHLAGYSNVGGDKNICIGHLSGYSNISGERNVFIGYNTGHDNNSSYNTFIGDNSGSVNTRNYTTFIGAFSGYQNNNIQNTFIGSYSGAYCDTGAYNTFVGVNSGFETEGHGNVYLGYAAGKNHQKGNRNVFLGYGAGLNTDSTANNVYIGQYSGDFNTNGSNNLYLGNKSGMYAKGSNQLIIENTDNDSTQALIYGEFDNDLLAFNAQVGIGTLSPFADLHIEKTNDATLLINADTDNSNESDNCRIEMRQDGNQVIGGIGYIGENGALYTGSAMNSFYMVNQFNSPLQLGTNNLIRMTILGDGKVGINTNSPTDMLEVNGNIRITNGNLIDAKTIISDKVLNDGYQLETIEEHAAFMWKEKHLPAVTSAEEINKKNGYDMSERREQILEEVEKAHIYIHQLNERVKELESRDKIREELIKQLEEEINRLKKRLK